MAAVKEFPIEEIQEQFAYLDALRDSGSTNMFGAGAWLQNEFALDRKTAGNILSAWMSTFARDKPVRDRAIAAREAA